MRLDKWLKVSRIIKRRTVANEVCDKNRIKVNDRTAKASSEIKVGDMLEVNLGTTKMILEVMRVPGDKQNVTTQESKELFNLISKTKSGEEI